MSDPKKIETAAVRLRKAEETGKTCKPIRDLIGETDIAAAYAIQQQNTRYRLERGDRLVGRKIGLTSFAVQKQLGVDQPDFGALFKSREVQNGGHIAVTEMMQPRVETEIAFVLANDLEYENLTTIDILDSIDYALASIEIVGSRIKDWDIRITDTIADNASASHFVLGHRPTPLSFFDVVNCAMEMEVNGIVVSKGTGGACMGSPVNACLWLAKTMAANGTPLKAGDIILTGALGPVHPVKAGDFVKASIEGLGTVSVNFI
ncbi:MAG: fumarylacetoacetate hydrolase family protein [Saprospiraceae bacterium]|nr:fumarylacetoacetate hydrolase family protein [Saprospiraceae bacterium]